ncbi:hypothetical protein ACFFX0_17135 [Citricoccus parietis]|uniref:Uncharacterized protein n=1 Tax=Citricoccus parietis TaxID=592307 RepID=A0ABV5G1L8_9MICC
MPRVGRLPFLNCRPLTILRRLARSDRTKVSLETRACIGSQGRQGCWKPPMA